MIGREIQDEPKAEALVPPRPNLGPEPWPSGPRWTPALGLAVVTFAVVVIMIGVAGWRSRRAKRNRPDSSSLRNRELDTQPSPREQLIATSERVRDELIRSFGSGWGSKTSEEIGQDPALLGRLEPDEVSLLIAFLKLVDRAKFAEGDFETVDPWETWTEPIFLRLKAVDRPRQKSRVGS